MEILIGETVSVRAAPDVANDKTAQKVDFYTRQFVDAMSPTNFVMTNPEVLILDEATEGLAPLIAREIWRICEVIRDSGISSIIVDKNWKHVTQISNRNVILVKGEVVFDGDTPSLLADPELLQKHLGV